MAAMDFPVTIRRAIAIRKVLMEDVILLRQLRQIMHDFIPYEKGHVIEDLLRQSRGHEPNYSEALIRILLMWKQAQPEKATFHALIKILRGRNLNLCADNLGSARNRRAIFDSETKELTILEFECTNFSVNTSRGKIAQLILKDYPVALRKWGEVTDDFMLDANEIIEISEMGLAEAVDESLGRWANAQGTKATLHKLLTILHNHGLHDLKKALMTKADEFLVAERPEAEIPSPHSGLC